MSVAGVRLQTRSWSAARRRHTCRYSCWRIHTLGPHTLTYSWRVHTPRTHSPKSRLRGPLSVDICSQRCYELTRRYPPRHRKYLKSPSPLSRLLAFNEIVTGYFFNRDAGVTETANCISRLPTLINTIN